MSKQFSVQDDVSIQNIVGSGELPVEIDIDAFADGMEERFGYSHFSSREEADSSEDNPDGFTWLSGGDQPGLYYEVNGEEGPQVTFHESGSYIVRADSEDELYETNDRVVSEIKDIGVIGESSDREDLDFSIENVVALAVLDQDIKLRTLQMGLGSDAQYEPEVFPALEYTTSDYPCTFLIYGNGKIIAAGSDGVDSAEESMRDFYDEIYESYLQMK